MELTIKRLWKKSNYTIGKLYIYGEHVCDVLEDVDRGLTSDMSKSEISDRKVYGMTAIPTGRYKIDMSTVSPKFCGRPWAKPYDGKLPRLLDVPGFSEVLIHVGNSMEDTLGCILVGNNRAVGKVLDSTKCFHELMREYLIPAKERNEAIYITIS